MGRSLHINRGGGGDAGSVADPESGAFLTPGSRISDPESWILNPFFESLVAICWVIKFFVTLSIGSTFFLYLFKNKIN
jgi:hypothetical protein